MSSDRWVPVEVDVTVRYLLPSDLTLRQSIYGTTDPAECVEIDLDVDSGSFFESCDDIRISAVGEVES